MDTSKMNATLQSVGATLTTVGLRVVGAIVLYMLGRALISWLIHLVQRTLERHKVDPTGLRYVGTIISVLASIALVIAILGYFGVETTSFAALLAGAGLAIGTAWGGLLSNFAAGACLVILVAQLHHSVGVADAIGRLKSKWAAIANVVTQPSPDVEILSFTEFGPVLAVRPYTHTASYWQVYFDANKAIVAAGGEGHFPPVDRTLKVRTLS